MISSSTHNKPLVIAFPQGIYRGLVFWFFILLGIVFFNFFSFSEEPPKHHPDLTSETKDEAIPKTETASTSATTSEVTLPKPPNKEATPPERPRKIRTDPPSLASLPDLPRSFRGIMIGSTLAQVSRVIEGNGTEISIPKSSYFHFTNSSVQPDLILWVIPTVLKKVEAPPQTPQATLPDPSIHYPNQIVYLSQQMDLEPFKTTLTAYESSLALRSSGTLFLKHITMLDVPAPDYGLIWGDVQRISIYFYEGWAIGFKIYFATPDRFQAYKEKYAVKDRETVWDQEQTTEKESTPLTYYAYENQHFYMDESQSMIAVGSHEKNATLFHYVEWALAEDSIRVAKQDYAALEGYFSNEQATSLITILKPKATPHWVQSEPILETKNGVEMILFNASQYFSPLTATFEPEIGLKPNETKDIKEKHAVALINRHILMELEKSLSASFPDDLNEVRWIINQLNYANNTILYTALTSLESHWEVRYVRDQNLPSNSDRIYVVSFQQYGISKEDYLVIRNRVLDEYANSPVLGARQSQMVQEAVEPMITKSEYPFSPVPRKSEPHTSDQKSASDSQDSNS